MQAKKSLGQNFLKDKGILKKIADFAQIDKGDMVVEVGPGEGTLTEFLLKKAKKIIAVEKDERMAKFLEERFKKEIEKRKLEIICEDVLKLPDDFFFIFLAEKSPKREKKSPGSRSQNYKLVGNVPYYITGALFKKVLGSRNPPESITFVIQKEVVDRIMARDGKESILSISIKAYGKPEYGGVIKAGSFYPKPKVDSAILSIRNISKERFLRSDFKSQGPKGQTLSPEKRLFEILRAGFAHKRKLLARNLNKFEKGGSLKEIFEKCGIQEKARAENLGVEDWLCLAEELTK